MCCGFNRDVDEGVAGLPVLPQLELLEGGEDEGDGGDEDHEEGEVGHELCSVAGPGVLLWSSMENMETM